MPNTFSSTEQTIVCIVNVINSNATMHWGLVTHTHQHLSCSVRIVEGSVESSHNNVTFISQCHQVRNGFIQLLTSSWAERVTLQTNKRTDLALTLSHLHFLTTSHPHTTHTHSFFILPLNTLATITATHSHTSLSLSHTTHSLTHTCTTHTHKVPFPHTITSTLHTHTLPSLPHTHNYIPPTHRGWNQLAGVPPLPCCLLCPSLELWVWPHWFPS